MISDQQLAEALRRLDPRDWEVLDLSLRRRVPDEALAKIFEAEPSEVARRRASAIENLADVLGVQRGEDLGAVLKALLDADTWETAEGGAGDGWQAFSDPAAAAKDPLPPAEEEPEPPELKTSEAARLFRLTPAPDPLAPEPEPPTALPPKGSPAGKPVEEQVEEPVAETGPKPAAEAAAPPRNGSGRAPRPVLEMLGERGSEGRAGRRTPVVWVLAGCLGLAALLGAGWVGATRFDDSGGTSPSGGDGSTRRFLPERGGPLAAPFPSDPDTTSCYTTAYVRRPAMLYSSPGGRRSLKLPASTEWGSPRVLSVVRRRGDWLAVLAPELKNGEVGWMQAEQAGSIDCVRWSLHVDLSQRRLFVRRDGHTVKELRIAIGAGRHPTPTGRFAVTDKLRVTDKGSPYGCCVLALTGHQNQLPQDWPGGDRLAVHATTDLSSIGKPVSLGCMRSQPASVRWLIRAVPLGSPIFIRA